MVPLILIFCPSWEWSGTAPAALSQGCRGLGGPRTGLGVLEKRTISLHFWESNHDFSNRAAGVYYTDYSVQIPIRTSNLLKKAR
jgi:hypothetical protein